MITIESLNPHNIKELVHLLGLYQAFYKSQVNPAHNHDFLAQFLDHEKGIFFLAKHNGEYIGYASLYFSYSSVTAQKIAILNDLYVIEEYRGQQYGTQLIDHVIAYAKELGIKQVRWCTRIENEQAQKLYAKYDANQTDWFHYDLVIL